MTQALLSGVLMGGVYALLSLGFQLKLRIADTVNLAYGAFVVLGMYITLLAVNDAGLPTPLALLLSAAGLGVFAYLVYKLLIESSRRSGHREQIVYTLILLSIMEILFQTRFGTALQVLAIEQVPVEFLGATVSRSRLVAGLVAVAIGIALYVVFKRTAFGKTIEVAGTYEDGARAIGIPVERVFMGVFVFGSVLAGVAGSLIVTFQPVSPYLGLEFVLIALLVAISARLNFAGCLVVGVAYGMAESVLTFLVGPELGRILVFCGFLLVLAAEEIASRARRVATKLGRPSASVTA